MTINIVSQLTNVVKKHSNFIQPIATISILATSFLTINPQSVSAVTLALHEGANNPVEQGWTRRTFVRGVSDGLIINDQNSGIDAWFIDDNSRVNRSLGDYIITLTDEDVENAMTQGWTLTTRLRVVDIPDSPDYSIWSSFHIRDKQFTLAFGSNNNGDPIVVPRQSFYAPGGTPIELTGFGSGYHTYKLSYDPQLEAATLFVNGIEMLSGYEGFSSSNTPLIAFGSRSSPTTGQGNYNLIKFEVGQPVPEPLTILGAGTAISFGVAFKRKLRHKKS